VEEGLRKLFKKVRNNLIAACHQKDRSFSMFFLHQLALDLTSWWAASVPEAVRKSSAFCW